GMFQCVNSAAGQCEIDGTSGTHAHASHIRASFVDLNGETALHKFQCEKRPIQPSTDYRYSLACLRHREALGIPGYSVSRVRASHSSGKNFLSRVSFRYDDPALPPVPMRAPITRSTS